MTDPTAVDTRKTIGRYEIRECVGRGGMGALFRGHDPVLDREVAIKTMLADFTGDEAGRTRFFREARAIARLQHRNIVTLFDFGEEDGTPYIVMEFLHGETLAERMKSHHGGRVPIDRVLDVGAQLCTGLHFAHARGVVHRDVKPPNIWLMEDGSVKVLDFGIAKFGDTAVTRVGGVVGSVSYMSPEQISGAEVDGRSDIFSVGIVLYELVSGKRPFVGESPTAIMMRIVHEPPPQLDEPGVPPQLLALIERALQKDRSRRFQQAGELASDLRALQFSLSGPHRGARLPDHLQTTAPVGAGGAGWAGAGPAGMNSAGSGGMGWASAGLAGAGAASAGGAGLAGAGAAGAGGAGLAGSEAAGSRAAGSGAAANASAGVAAGALSSSATALPPRAAFGSDAAGAAAGAVQHAPGGWAMSNADDLVADVVLNSSPSARDAGVAPVAAARARSKPAASSGFDWAKRWPALAVAGGAIAIASFVFVLLMRAEPATVGGGTTTGAAGSDSNAATHGNATPGNATPGNATPGHPPARSATPGNATTSKAAGKTTGDVSNVGKNVAVAPVAGDPTGAGAPTSPNGGAAAAPPATPAVDSNALHVVFTASYPFSVTDDSGNPLSASAPRHELSLAPKQVVRLRSSHYHLNQRVTIDGKPVRLPAPGFLSVRATRETCKLSLNGEAIGTPPVADLPVASGKYTLRLTCPDGDDDVSYVTVPPGESVLAKIQ